MFVPHPQLHAPLFFVICRSWALHYPAASHLFFFSSLAARMLTLYGIPISQPYRSVMWALLMKTVLGGLLCIQPFFEQLRKKVFFIYSFFLSFGCGDPHWFFFFSDHWDMPQTPFCCFTWWYGFSHVQNDVLQSQFHWKYETQREALLTNAQTTFFMWCRIIFWGGFALILGLFLAVCPNQPTLPPGGGAEVGNRFLKSNWHVFFESGKWTPPPWVGEHRIMQQTCTKKLVCRVFFF